MFARDCEYQYCFQQFSLIYANNHVVDELV